MDNVATLVEPLQRAVAVPGTFATAYPNTSEDDLTGMLLDGLAEAQLDGFFSDLTYGVDPEDEPTYGILDTEVGQPESALIVIYAATRLLSNELTSRKTHIRYEASGAVFEQDQSAQVLTERLKELNGRLKDIRERAQLAGMASAFYMADMYVSKALDYSFWPDTVSLDWG